jgi:hypothetical protein
VAGIRPALFAIEHLRALAGLAPERREPGAAEQLAEQALSLSERGGRSLKFLALLERAGIWAARGQVRAPLATVEAARLVLAGTGSVLLAGPMSWRRCCACRSATCVPRLELASGLPAARRRLLLARIALAAGDHHAALWASQLHSAR